ncbi:hypothetical protein [Aureibacter tunicatorum]|uniref:Uncharacterized protein n=1 Tax=Aureibacter tunicatorum TaxID=866807 RepID=A0AAE3XPG2_9BACT|nr:hypothetical protein [Aureibacter tunicatorum]MDR6241656.1 hypothetical protein [Aureibacter tunicatorum]BDD07358.1 hypothetical protein AUTU_48410 [Aureibacter tunicatorum]
MLQNYIKVFNFRVHHEFYDAFVENMYDIRFSLFDEEREEEVDYQFFSKKIGSVYSICSKEKLLDILKEDLVKRKLSLIISLVPLPVYHSAISDLPETDTQKLIVYEKLDESDGKKEFRKYLVKDANEDDNNVLMQPLFPQNKIIKQTIQVILPLNNLKFDSSVEINLYINSKRYFWKYIINDSRSKFDNVEVDLSDKTGLLFELDAKDGNYTEFISNRSLPAKKSYGILPHLILTKQLETTISRMTLELPRPDISNLTVEKNADGKYINIAKIFNNI